MHLLRWAEENGVRLRGDRYRYKIVVPHYRVKDAVAEINGQLASTGTMPASLFRRRLWVQHPMLRHVRVERLDVRRCTMCDELEVAWKQAMIYGRWQQMIGTQAQLRQHRLYCPSAGGVSM